MNRMTGERCVYSCAVRTHTTMPKDELRTQGTLNSFMPMPACSEFVSLQHIRLPILIRIP